MPPNDLTAFNYTRYISCRGLIEVFSACLVKGEEEKGIELNKEHFPLSHYMYLRLITVTLKLEKCGPCIWKLMSIEIDWHRGSVHIFPHDPFMTVACYSGLASYNCS